MAKSGSSATAAGTIILQRSLSRITGRRIEMRYLYSKVQEKIEELMRKSSPRMEMDMESLKRSLPNKMRITRYDVMDIIKELEKDGIFFKDGNKLRKREVQQHG